MSTMSEKLRKYRLTQTQTMANIKDLAGKTVTPVDCLTHDYLDQDGEKHTVLAIDCGDAGMYRTEVSAFIEAFSDYWGVFGEIADGETRPAITITTKSSKRGNPYVSFTVTAQ